MIASKTTKQSIDGIISNPPHALLIHGQEGVGKLFVANHVVAKTMDLRVDEIDSHRYVLRVKPIKNTIGISDIRTMTKHLLLKTIGARPLRRAIIIEDAHTMTLEAQNALLKTLEEPPADTIVVLTTNSASSLLPTIHSRSMALYIPTINYSDAKKHFVHTNLDQLFALSQGRVGLLHALVNDDQHPLSEAIHIAKSIIAAPLTERLAKVTNLNKNKQEQRVIGAIATIARAGREAAANKGQLNAVERWNNMLQQALYAQQIISSNAQPKLVLTNLFINL